MGDPKIMKDAPARGEPVVCEHGTWTRPHVIRCQKCFPFPEPPTPPSPERDVAVRTLTRMRDGLHLLLRDPGIDPVAHPEFRARAAALDVALAALTPPAPEGEALDRPLTVRDLVTVAQAMAREFPGCSLGQPNLGALAHLFIAALSRPDRDGEAL